MRENQILGSELLPYSRVEILGKIEKILLTKDAKFAIVCLVLDVGFDIKDLNHPILLFLLYLKGV